MPLLFFQLECEVFIPVIEKEDHEIILMVLLLAFELLFLGGITFGPPSVEDNDWFLILVHVFLVGGIEWAAL